MTNVITVRHPPNRIDGGSSRPTYTPIKVHQHAIAADELDILRRRTERL